MKKGKLKFFNRFKGYGIITDFTTGEEFHVSPAGMQDNIKDGDQVVFEAVEGRGKMNAVEIRLDTFTLNTQTSIKFLNLNSQTYNKDSFYFVLIAK